MAVTLPCWIIPLLSAAGIYMMVRPYKRHGDYDFGMVFRLFWLIPVAFVWTVYFAIMLALRP